MSNLTLTSLNPDDGYWFGLGVFETIWVKQNTAVFLEEHLIRLKKSALFSAFPFPAAHFFPVTGGNRQGTAGNRLGTAKAPIVKNLTFHRETTHLSSFKTSPIIV
mgnify:CR=1 FL=1